MTQRIYRSLANIIVVIVFSAMGGLLGPSPGAAQSFNLDWHTIGNGGGTSTGGVYSVNALIGEPVAGSMSGNGYTLEDGFAGLLGESVNLVVNGSFENMAGTFAPDGNQVMSLAVGSTNIPGWTVINAELLWGNNTNVFGPRTPYGAFFVDLTGYHDSPPYAGVSQTIATTPGQNYRLAFSLGADQDVFAYRGPVSVAAMVGSVSNVFTLTPVGGATGNVWMSFTLDFTATNSSTSLKFFGTTATGGAYLGLDNISVVPLSPDLSISSIQKLGDNLQLAFTTVAGKSYAIQSHTNLASLGWITLPGTTNSDAGGTVTLMVTNAFTEPRQFYRVQQLP